MKNRVLKYIVLLLIGLLWSCSISSVYYSKNERGWAVKDTLLQNNNVLYSFYVVGDAGGDTTYSGPVMRNLRKRIDQDATNKGIIFLGDNIYPEGMHKKDHPMRAQDEARLNMQLNVVKGFAGEVVFIPGNHDWERQGAAGWKFINRQERYVNKQLDEDALFLPEDACPGPEVVELTPGVVMIIVDSQWWVHQHDRPSGEKDGCAVRTTDELMVQFRDLLKKYRNQQVIVAAHHPLFSNGHHGGRFPFKEHLFPLTALNKKLYIPLPVIGSVYPFYRKFLGHPQDIAHPVYQDMKTLLLGAMNEYDNTVYIAGHEHNLQYLHERNVHHIVSGAGSKVTYLKKGGNGMDFGAQNRGYSKLTYFENGDVLMTFYTTDELTKTEKLVFTKKLYNKELVNLSGVGEVPKVSYADQFATVIPDSTYAANKLKRTFFGDLNRDLWTKAVKVPVLDIHYEYGGLTPIKKGGGMQTLSLRMQGGDGNQYSLRAIKKNSRFLIAKELRGTIAQDIIYDGIAGSHPYASVAIPTLADAVGVYHTNPKLVYLPKDSILGDYMEEFGGTFCLMEIRPKGDMSDYDHFGNSEKVIGYDDAIKKMHKKQHHVVDHEYTVKARLFDILIGDWDRHDDQWRWATFEEGDQKVYRPIPRDRDQAFFQFDGFFMNITNRKWAVRKFQPFREDIRDIAGLGFNSRYFDRAFLVEATKEDWRAAAKAIQEDLSDEAIEKAIRELPEESFEINGAYLIETLKARRAKLVTFAESFYDILARDVSVTGTLKDDYFEVIRMEGGGVELNIYPRKDGKKVETERFFHRIFKREETQEIRLYGLEGNDEYKIEGESNKSILVRIISGPDKDKIEDKSTVRGLSKRTKVYETKGKNKLDLGSETRLYTRSARNAYDYDRKDFVYDKLMPGIELGFNPNDGFYIGPGFTYTKHGFKKKPYWQKHKASFSYGVTTGLINLSYDFDIINLVRSVDLAGKFRVNRPLIFQYFGSGNETNVTSDLRSVGNTQMNQVIFRPKLKLASISRSQEVSLGLNLEQYEVIQTPENVNTAEGVTNVVGATFDYIYNNKDHEVNPSRGFYFKTSLTWNRSFASTNLDFVRTHSEMGIHIPLSFIRKQTTLNLRSGLSHNMGDYLFFQANFLDGFENFRGVNRNRFAGRTNNYNSAELRYSLFKVRNYIAPFDVGLIAHSDLARVWEDNEDSDLWHTSFGGGAFINLMSSFVLTGTYSVSDVDEVLLIGTKFFF